MTKFLQHLTMQIKNSSELNVGTKPPGIISLKWKKYNFMDYQQDEAIDPYVVKFVHPKREIFHRTPPKYYLVEYMNIQDKQRALQTINAGSKYYRLWTQNRAAFNLHEEIYENDLNWDFDKEVRQYTTWNANLRMYVKAINNFGDSNIASFILPFKNLRYFDEASDVGREAQRVLRDFQDIYSWEARDEKKRARTIYIYLDTFREIVERDRVLLNNPDWEQTHYLPWKKYNGSIYRWLISESEASVLQGNGWKSMTNEEKIFIKQFLEPFLNDIYYAEANQKVSKFKPFRFKAAIQDPFDPDSSIVIYVMKGCSWIL
jgi:hypothetical protein